MGASYLRRICRDDRSVGALAREPTADVLPKSMGATAWLALRSAISAALLTSFGVAAAAAGPRAGGGA
jgi:hypothetical protein